MFEPTLKSVSGWMHKPLKLIARVLAAKNNNQEHEHYYGQADAHEPTTTTTTTKDGEPCFKTGPLESEMEHWTTERA